MAWGIREIFTFTKNCDRCTVPLHWLIHCPSNLLLLAFRRSNRGPCCWFISKKPKKKGSFSLDTSSVEGLQDWSYGSGISVTEIFSEPVRHQPVPVHNLFWDRAMGQTPLFFLLDAQWISLCSAPYTVFYVLLQHCLINPAQEVPSSTIMAI